MISQEYVENGKCWLINVFEQISAELGGVIVIAHWEAQEDDPAYLLRFQIAEQDEETFPITKGTLRSCARRDFHAVRQRVEAAIRLRLTRSATGAG
jgi:hypothetical protein